jgi:hypothetical protein
VHGRHIELDIDILGRGVRKILDNALALVLGE